ncbi:MAG: hypothetical protein ACOYN0_05970 [Phycisphaerales bacterium]
MRRMTTRWIVLTLSLFIAPFTFAAFDDRSVARVAEGAMIAVVGWGVLVVVGIFGILLLNRADHARLRELGRTLRARRLQVCRRCGYDLAGAREDGDCPECGLAFTMFADWTAKPPARDESPADPPPNPPGR